MRPELRTAEGTFAKGVSGNPGGVSKRLRKARKALQRLDEPALKRLAALINSDDEKVAVAALSLWAKYSLPVPRETKAEQENRAAGLPTLSPTLREKLARMQ